MRPPFIKETAAAMLVLSMGWMFLLNSGMTMRETELALAAFAVRCAVTWSYWMGRNWTRIPVILYSSAAVARLFQLSHVSGLTRELWLAEAGLAVFLFILLPQRDVNAWFNSHKVSQPPQSTLPPPPPSPHPCDPEP